MPTVNVNIPTPPSEAIIDTTVIPFKTLSIDKTKWYRVTDATPVPCIVSGASVGSSSALAFLEGESDGTGITSVGGTGTYDLATGTFAYAFLYDPIKKIVYEGVNPSDNTVGINGSFVTFQNNAISNVVADLCTNIYFGQGANSNSVGESSASVMFEQSAQLNTVGLGCSSTTFKEASSNFVFGNDFNFCTIWTSLNGLKADDSAPIDFITGVTFLYNRTSPWEIRDIDRTAELIFLYVTYGDGSDPEEGWYDPATDTFTPIAGGGVATVTGTAVDNTDPTNPVIDNQVIPYQNQGQHAQLPLSSTRYILLDGIYGVTLTASSQAVYRFKTAGVFAGGEVRTVSSQPATGSLTITLASGSNPTSLTDSSIVMTIASGSAGGVYTSGNTLTIAANDYAAWKGVNGATLTSAQLADGYIGFTPS